MENKNNTLGSTVHKLILFKGVALTIVGLILLFFPQATLVTLIFVMGFYWIIDGVSTLIKSIQGRKVYNGWGWGIVTGILGTLAGVIVLSGPLLSAIFTTTFLMLFIGFSSLIYGVSELLTGFRLPKGAGRSSLIWGGILSIFFGAVLLASPYASAISIIIALGIFTVVGGIILIIIASKMKKAIEDSY